MNEHISWDSSLVKKFSTSNHFKLINQLRNEVKKYPLIKKNKISSDLKNDNNVASNKGSKPIAPVDIANSKEYSQITENNNNKSNIGFNNSKNFSIYKNNYDSNNELKRNKLSQDDNCIEESSSPTFKDRLNKVDMK